MLPQRFHAGKVDYQAMSFAELDLRSSHLALGFTEYGIGVGVRAVVMVRPSAEFFLIMFALLKARAVPVLVDPGIDKKALKQCLANAQPSAFVGISLAHAARKVLGWGKPSITRFVTVGRRWFWGGAQLSQIEAIGAAKSNLLPQLDEQIRATPPDSLAAILFTSGSTGVPKGVEYLHRMFVAQVALLRSAFQIAPGTFNLPTFPPFALFDPALGCTSVIPMMDATQPAKADPRKLISAISQFNIQQMFGSPALLRTLCRYLQQTGEKITELKTVMSAGAPVPPDLVELAKQVLPNARVFTPYGATEALPVAVVDDHTLLGPARAKSEAGMGICIGRVLPENSVRIISISDAPIARMQGALLCATGEIGEITVRGPSVTEAYAFAPAKTAAAKIIDIDGRVVHRMGDVGYLDADGLLWYCGRKSHRVESAQGPMFTECIEALFNQHNAVLRTALVGITSKSQPSNSATPVILIELMKPETLAMTQILSELKHIAASDSRTRHIQHFLHYPRAFPVDIRHNAKINREQLAVWAKAQLT
jgi:olefin beta-lactone synthetase